MYRLHNRGYYSVIISSHTSINIIGHFKVTLYTDVDMWHVVVHCVIYNNSDDTKQLYVYCYFQITWRFYCAAVLITILLGIVHFSDLILLFVWLTSFIDLNRNRNACVTLVHAFMYIASHHNWCTQTLLNRRITAQWEGMGDRDIIGSARYEPALFIYMGLKLQ